MPGRHGKFRRQKAIRLPFFTVSKQYNSCIETVAMVCVFTNRFHHHHSRRHGSSLHEPFSSPVAMVCVFTNHFHHPSPWFVSSRTIFIRFLSPYLGCSKPPSPWFTSPWLLHSRAISCCCFLGDILQLETPVAKWTECAGFLR